MTREVDEGMGVGVRFGSRASEVWMSAALGLLLVGCSSDPRGPVACEHGKPAGPSTCAYDAPPPAITAQPSEVGPSPLRRLSNQEYLFSLQDLFPNVRVELPVLPNDGDVGGFENAVEGQAPSDVRIARYETIASTYAAAVTVDADAVRALVGCDYSSPGAAEACAETFVATTGRRLFRRPLGDEERDRLLVRFKRWANALDFEAAVELTLSALLQAPQFLYRPELPSEQSATGALVHVDPYALASRLSFFLWASVPDEALLAAAAADQLQTNRQIVAQATRMLQDPRARRVLWDFHRQWLGLDRVLDEEHAVRTPEVDARWTPRRQQAVYDESRLFVENVLARGGSLKDLLLSRRAWLDADLRDFYGVTGSDSEQGDAFVEVELPERERAGILTRGAFLAGHSHRGATSPPIRANALQLRLLCRPPAPPPANLDTTPPVASATDGPQTNRTLFEVRTAPPACIGCHRSLNGIGFGFENYNAAGKFTLLDHGLPIDSSGRLHGTDVDRDFTDAVALSEALSQSRDVSRCAVSQWLRYALGRAPVEGEGKLIDSLTTRFVRDGGSVHDLLLGVVTSPSFRYQQAGT